MCSSRWKCEELVTVILLWLAPAPVVLSDFRTAGTSLVAQTVKRLSTMRETWVWSLGREDPLEKEVAIHSSTLAWKIPWTEEPGRLQSMGSQRVRHDWVTSLSPSGQLSVSSAFSFLALMINVWSYKIIWQNFQSKLRIKLINIMGDIDWLKWCK